MSESRNFIEEIIENDLASGKVKEIYTRFPPEPNGYLHVGHAKSLCINFGLAEKYHGKCNLRFDDTNPAKEDEEYVESIKRDIEWLGFKWDKLLFASDYFDVMYQCAVTLIQKGLAYVSDETAEEIRLRRGTLTQAGEESPFRNRSVEENLKLFAEMKAGKYADGEKVLRAKIDMASPNINMRDPVLYRVLHATHHNTGDKWCIYPMYDFAHPIEDAYEGITHSICTLEFEDHRPLYDWVVRECGFAEPRPQQIEFARLNVQNTIMSKRFLKKLVDEGKVMGWDDPRMPTLSGMRRRGYPPQALKNFCERVGVAKANSEVEESYLYSCVRECLNLTADRVMAVFDPVKVVLTNYQGRETVSVENNPNAPQITTRQVPFGKVIYIDGSDFSLDPPPKYHRLKPDGYVRLKGAYIIHCDEVVTENGKVVQLNCSVVPGSRSGSDESGLKVKGVIQWVDSETCADVTVRKLQSLLNDAVAGETDFSLRFNADSMKTVSAKVENSLLSAKVGDSFQFMRVGYYVLDRDSKKGSLVFNEIVGLKDSFKQ
ncbi:MAG TPA: glutamine--tRNA ligase/YqeY domain fusion protein [Candidatus Fimimonas merdipullorum]|uniref:Glutamine--tRNA ligase n=1 Tax=Candidatus Fimimonas merdipullorum TaxID=2840822 RepID=A0A9D1MX47_9BACT|nr:glutamine--tRNA ligase/YqeY domain fusion protein [Candidatus Fimimonas merdipullorum]